MSIPRDIGGVRRAMPAARFNDLVITETGAEVLAYDQERHHIHHLNPTTAAIWRLCDGKRSVHDLARAATAVLGDTVNPEMVTLALVKLDDANLLASPLDNGMRIVPQSRRAFMKRAAVAGAVTPVLISISAPRASASGSIECNPALGPAVVEGGCNDPGVEPGRCCCDVPGQVVDPGCGVCGFEPGDSAMDCIGAN